jgi:hypothetical protein
MPGINWMPMLMTILEFSLCKIAVSESQFHIDYFKNIGLLIPISLCSGVHSSKGSLHILRRIIVRRRKRFYIAKRACFFTKVHDS